MSANTSKPALVFLRSYLTDKPGQSTNAVKSWAFSPDIVPQFGNTPSESQLTTSYANFISLPLMPYENNNVYVRGITASNAKTTNSAFTLLAVPSELILWPQVWNKTTPVGPGPLIVDGESANELVAAQAPFTIRPSNLGGFNYSLISVQSATPPPTPNAANNTRLRDALPSLPASVGNWRDYYKFLTTDQTTVYSSIIVADPTSPLISISTRLRMFEDDSSQGPASIQLLIEHAGISSDTQVSISSDNGGISLARTSIGAGSGDVGVHVQLADGFDATITLNIFPPANSLINDYSWISLQASTLSTDGDGISTESILGAQNIVFEADATRNARFASPAAVASKSGAGASKFTSGALGDDSGTNPVVGWWFRDNIGDTNAYPRDGVNSHSPDIQALGTVPDSNVVADLGGNNQNTDVTDANGVNLVGGAPNFINLRGNCTLGQYEVQSRLFAVPCNILISPSQYANWSVNDHDSNGNPFWAMRDLTTANNDDFNVFGNPFNLLNPPPASTFGSDHYCMIAETRHPTSFNPDPNWPHENVGDFSTGADFNAWVAGISTVAWRNIGYTTDGGGATSVYPTTMTIPADKYSPSTTWLLTVNGYNVPVGASWALTGSGDPIPGVTIGFLKSDITSNIMTQGVHFTGLPSAGYNCSLTLQYWSNGKQIPPGNPMKFQYSLIATGSTPGPAVRLAKPLPVGAKDWPLFVGSHHPGLPKHKNSKGRHPLVPLYDHVGQHAHPHAVHHGHHGHHKKRSHKKGLLGDDVEPTVGYNLGGDSYQVKVT